VLIGNDCVELDGRKCLDLRGKLSLEDFAWVCKNSQRLITNDSSPLHLAACGGGKVAYLSTVRHPDLLMHWRSPHACVQAQFGYNMRCFVEGEPWRLFDNCPNNLGEQRIDRFPIDVKIEDYLSDPEEVIEWIA